MKAFDRAPVSADGKLPRCGHRAKGSKPEYGRRKARSNYLDLTGLVRSVQRSDGHLDCFRRGFCDCDQLDCPWRAQCFQKG